MLPYGTHRRPENDPSRLREGTEVYSMANEQLPTGSVAIVVGAAGEIGRATALKLVERGMTVVAVDRNRHGLEGLPDGIALELVDATAPNAAAPLIERIARDVGLPDALVNTVGAFQAGDVLTTTTDVFRLMIDVNLGPALWVSTGGGAVYAEEGLRSHCAHRLPAGDRACGRYGRLRHEQGSGRPPNPHPRPRAAATGHPGQHRRPATDRHGKE